MTEPQTAVLKPAEAIALTVALAQVLRGEEPTPNIATVCVLALARLTGKHDWTDDPTDYRADPCNQPENIR